MRSFIPRGVKGCGIVGAEVPLPARTLRLFEGAVSLARSKHNLVGSDGRRAAWRTKAGPARIEVRASADAMRGVQEVMAEIWVRRTRVFRASYTFDLYGRRGRRRMVRILDHVAGPWEDSLLDPPRRSTS